MNRNRCIIGGLSALLSLGFVLGCGEQKPVPATEPSALPLAGTQVAVLTGNGVQDLEATVPIGYLVSYGATTTVIGADTGEVTAYNSDLTVMVAHTVDEVDVDHFDALIIPGGHAPEALRQQEAVVEFARAFFQSGKPVAAICHGPQILVTAGVLEGKQATCYSGMKEEYVEAGVSYVDQAVVIDGNLITSRNPEDLPAFCQALRQALTSS